MKYVQSSKQYSDISYRKLIIPSNGIPKTQYLTRH